MNYLPFIFVLSFSFVDLCQGAIGGGIDNPIGEFNKVFVEGLYEKVSQTKSANTYNQFIVRTFTGNVLSSSNPLADFWKALDELMSINNARYANLNALIQHVDNIVDPAYFLAFQELSQVFNDEGIKLSRDGSDAKAKEVGGDLIRCSKILEIIRNGTNVKILTNFINPLFRNEPSASALQDAILSGMQIISVVEIINAVFQVSNSDSTAPLLYTITPIVEELAKPAYLIKEKLAATELQPALDKLTDAYFKCFGPYRRPFYKKSVFIYGLLMGLAFSTLLALTLWILIRRPNLDKPIDVKKTN